MILKKFKITLLLALVSNIFLPQMVLAKVSINEVAWMGNDKGQYGEWVELYNDGASPVDLKDTALYEAGGKTQIIKLTKSIAAGGYYLIARSTPSLPDPVSGLADDLGSFGGSGLSNSGEYLVLKSATGDVLDSIDASSGWPAGDVAGKLTMQMSVGKWITATGTPRAENVSDNTITTTNPNNTVATSSENNTQISYDTEFSNLSSHSSPADLSAKPEDVKIMASAGRNRLTLTDTPINFEEKLFNDKHEDLDGGNIFWSFGDGQTATGKLAVHTYKFPGDYAVVMNVLKNAENYVSRTNIRVVPAELDITDFTPDFVKIRNLSDYEANIGGWQIVSSRLGFTLPQDTIVLPKHEVILSKEVTGLGTSVDQLKLLSPSKNVVSVFKFKKDETAKSTNENMANIITSTSNKDTSIAAVLLSSEQKLLDAKKSLEMQASRIQDASKNSVAHNVSAVKEEVITVDGDDEGSQSDNIQASDKSGSFLKTLIDLPINSLRRLKDFLF